jgi:hypothetical protein
MPWPRLTPAELALLRRLPKRALIPRRPHDRDWIRYTLDHLEDGQTSLDVTVTDTAPPWLAEGTMRVVARQNPADPDDFSAMLLLDAVPPLGVLKVIRCNGPSHTHKNRWPKDRVPEFSTPHVHYLTSHHLREHVDNLRSCSPEHFAVPIRSRWPGGTGYSDLRGALVHLARRAGIECQHGLFPHG